MGGAAVLLAVGVARWRVCSVFRPASEVAEAEGGGAEAMSRSASSRSIPIPMAASEPENDEEDDEDDEDEEDEEEGAAEGDGDEDEEDEEGSMMSKRGAAMRAATFRCSAAEDAASASSRSEQRAASTSSCTDACTARPSDDEPERGRSLGARGFGATVRAVLFLFKRTRALSSLTSPCNVATSSFSEALASVSLLTSEEALLCTFLLTFNDAVAFASAAFAACASASALIARAVSAASAVVATCASAIAASATASSPRISSSERSLKRAYKWRSESTSFIVNRRMPLSLRVIAGRCVLHLAASRRKSGDRGEPVQ